MYQSSRSGGISGCKGPAGWAAVDAGSDFGDVSEQALLHHVDRTKKTVAVAPLLRADKEHQIGMLLAGVANQLVFFQRERERLLAEHVLARQQCLDRDLHVPVVGRDDAHHVDVVAVQHSAVILVGVRVALADPVVVLCSHAVGRVDVAYGHDITKLRVLLRVTRPHAASTDATDARSVVTCLVCERGLSPGEIGNRGESASRAQEITPSCSRLWM